MMENKITIIEGPTPEFEDIQESWLAGQNESPYPFALQMTQLRTFNGPGLVERCHRAWTAKHPMFLQYRDLMGLERSASIVAARAVETDDGDLLLLWVRRSEEDIQQEAQYPTFGPDDIDDLN
jgi:hypothetical protein